MKTPGPKSLGAAAAAIVLAAWIPATLTGQTLSPRPAAVSLIVVVPDDAASAAAPVVDAAARVVRRDATSLDLDANVELGGRTVSRVEVRLGPGWNADSAHVLVRNRAGLFEQIGTHARVVAVDAGHTAPPRSPLHYRIESTRPLSRPVAIPVEYRVTIGSGDEIAVWTFPSLVRPDPER